MIIKYWNYTIEEEHWWCILTESWVSEKWLPTILWTRYPSSIRNSLISIRDKMKSKDKRILELNEYIEAIDELHNLFLSDLTNLIWNQ